MVEIASFVGRWRMTEAAEAARRAGYVFLVLKQDGRRSILRVA
jgi:hypothetical protein